MQIELIPSIQIRAKSAEFIVCLIETESLNIWLVIFFYSDENNRKNNEIICIKKIWADAPKRFCF